MCQTGKNGPKNKSHPTDPTQPELQMRAHRGPVLQEPRQPQPPRLPRGAGVAPPAGGRRVPAAGDARLRGLWRSSRLLVYGTSLGQLAEETARLSPERAFRRELRALAGRARRMPPAWHEKPALLTRCGLHRVGKNFATIWLGTQAERCI